MPYGYSATGTGLPSSVDVDDMNVVEVRSKDGSQERFSMTVSGQIAPNEGNPADEIVGGDTYKGYVADGSGYDVVFFTGKLREFRAPNLSNLTIKVNGEEVDSSQFTSGSVSISSGGSSTLVRYGLIAAAVLLVWRLI